MKKIVGTADYLAPELIRDGDHDKSVDWWALGVIAYELMTGVRPFGAEQLQMVFENIINMRVNWPEIGFGEGQMSPSATDLIRRLLDPNPESRLGSGGPEEVQTHPFFANIKWASIREDEPPFVPQTENVLDTQYFDQSKLNFPTDKYIGDEPLSRTGNQRNSIAAWSSHPVQEKGALDNFDAIMYPTLAGLNKQAAKEAQILQEEEIAKTPCIKGRSCFDKTYSIQKLDMLKNLTHNPMLPEITKNKDTNRPSFFRNSKKHENPKKTKFYGENS